MPQPERQLPLPEMSAAQLARYRRTLRDQRATA